MDAKTKAIINELAHQRNQYSDAVAMLSGEIAERDARWGDVNAVKARLSELQKAARTANEAPPAAV